MALSNIFTEPKRELIESGVGTGAVLIGFILVLLFTRFFVHHITPCSSDKGCVPPELAGFLLGMILVFAGPFVVYGILFLFPHAVGEGICNALKRRGLELRPTDRYKRDSSGRIYKVPSAQCTPWN